MYAALPPQAEWLFLHFKLVMPRLQWSNHTVAPRPAINYERRDNYEEGLVLVVHKVWATSPIYIYLKFLLFTNTPFSFWKSQ